MVAEVKTDFDGVFREDNKEFQKMVGRLGVSFSYLPPEHHEGSGERQVGVMEETTKALLMERNLPGYHWGECTKAAEFLLNRYALSTDSLSSDGDAPRPLERLTGGHYSRRKIDRELGYYLGPGTLALVHDNRVKGSHVAAKTRFGHRHTTTHIHKLLSIPIYTSTKIKKTILLIYGKWCHRNRLHM